MLYPVLFVLAAQDTLASPKLSHRGQSTESCAVRGYDRGEHAYEYFSKTSLASRAKCGALCVSDPRCESFAFSTEACLLYSVAVSSNVDVDSESPYLFYDQACTSAASSPAGESSRSSPKPSGGSSNSPSGATCGNVGYDRGSPSAFYYKSSSATTFTGCSDLCKTQACSSFAISKTECLLYGAKVSGNFDSERSSPYTFYDSSCSSSIKSTAAPSATSKSKSTKRASLKTVSSAKPSTGIKRSHSTKAASRATPHKTSTVTKRHGSTIKTKTKKLHTSHSLPPKSSSSSSGHSRHSSVLSTLSSTLSRSVASTSPVLLSEASSTISTASTVSSSSISSTPSVQSTSTAQSTSTLISTSLVPASSIIQSTSVLSTSSVVSSIITSSSSALTSSDIISSSVASTSSASEPSTSSALSKSSEISISSTSVISPASSATTSALTSSSTTPAVISSSTFITASSTTPSTSSETLSSTSLAGSSTTSSATPTTSFPSSSSSSSSSSLDLQSSSTKSFPTPSATPCAFRNGLYGQFLYRDAGAFSWGMNGATNQGALFKVTSYRILGDKFFFSTYITPSQVQSAGSNVYTGYVYHEASGLCLTLNKPQNAVPQYQYGTISLQPCSCEVKAPDEQLWSVLNYDDSSSSYCLTVKGDLAGAPVASYGFSSNSYVMFDQNPQDAKVVEYPNEIADGRCFSFLPS